MSEMTLIPVTLGDGNAFAILGRCSAAMKKAGVYDEKWQSFYDEATSGDYDNLLRVVGDFFDITLESDSEPDSDL